MDMATSAYCMGQQQPPMARARCDTCGKAYYDELYREEVCRNDDCEGRIK